MLNRTTDGTAFTVSGDDSDPAVVLIHGLGLDHTTWDGHHAALAERYRVIRYDLFGHGQSALPPAEQSLTLFSEQIVALLDELGVDRCAAVGFSLGGMINRRLAMDHPDRVSALAILNSPHERDPAQQRLVEQRARDTTAGGTAAIIDATLERWFTPEFRSASPGVVRRVGEGVLANDPQAYADCRMVLAAGVVELIRPEPPITHPTLVMTCEHDSGSTPEMSHAIASEIVGSECIIVPRLQHMGLVEQPDLFTGPVLDFLDRVVN